MRKAILCLHKSVNTINSILSRNILVFTILLLILRIPLFAENPTDNGGTMSSVPALNEGQGIHLVFSEGASCGFIKRIAQKGNFHDAVFSDTLVGGYFQISSRNMQPLDAFIRFSAFSPLVFSCSDVVHLSNRDSSYSVDLFTGVSVPFSLLKIVNFNFSPGIHFNFQDTNQFKFVLLGGGIQLAIELPISSRWTILLDGTATYDYANLGTNGDTEPYDSALMYQLAFGVRYSRKSPNKYSYIK